MNNNDYVPIPTPNAKYNNMKRRSRTDGEGANDGGGGEKGPKNDSQPRRRQQRRRFNIRLRTGSVLWLFLLLVLFLGTIMPMTTTTTMTIMMVHGFADFMIQNTVQCNTPLNTTSILMNHAVVRAPKRHDNENDGNDHEDDALLQIELVVDSNTTNHPQLPFHILPTSSSSSLSLSLSSLLQQIMVNQEGEVDPSIPFQTILIPVESAAVPLEFQVRVQPTENGNHNQDLVADYQYVLQLQSTSSSSSLLLSSNNNDDDKNNSNNSHNNNHHHHQNPNAQFTARFVQGSCPGQVRVVGRQPQSQPELHTIKVMFHSNHTSSILSSSSLSPRPILFYLWGAWAANYGPVQLLAGYQFVLVTVDDAAAVSDSSTTGSSSSSQNRKLTEPQQQEKKSWEERIQDDLRAQLQHMEEHDPKQNQQQPEQQQKHVVDAVKDELIGENSHNRIEHGHFRPDEHNKHDQKEQLHHHHHHHGNSKKQTNQGEQNNQNHHNEKAEEEEEFDVPSVSTLPTILWQDSSYFLGVLILVGGIYGTIVISAIVSKWLGLKRRQE